MGLVRAQGLPLVVQSLDLGVEGSGTVGWSVGALQQGGSGGPGLAGLWVSLVTVQPWEGSPGESVRTREANSTDNAGSGRRCDLPSLGGPSPVRDTAGNSSLKSPGLWPLLLLKPAAPAEV